jgi:hypothetical protein
LTVSDTDLVMQLGLLHLPGASVVLPGLRPELRSGAARTLIAGSAMQDWPRVVAELDLPSERLASLALDAACDGAYQALRQRLAADGALDNAAKQLLLKRIAAPDTPTAARRKDLLNLAGNQVDGGTEDFDEAWLLKTAKAQPSGFHDRADMKLWAEVGVERWRRWWRDRTVDSAILTLAARTAARQRDPTTPLGRIAMAAVEEGGEVREQVLRELRQISYDWLFLLRHWAASTVDAERTRCESLLTQIDAQWPLRMAAAYTERGMLSDEHTKPLGSLIAQRPACLGQILGARASHIAANDRTTTPCKEVMMCYEFGAIAVGPALTLAEDATATHVARDNALLLLLVIKQQPPPDCANELPRITTALERLQRR